MKWLLGMVLAALAMATLHAHAENRETDAADWQFTGDRAPTYDKLWDIGEKFTDVGCKGWPDVLYENYARLHPGFRPLVADENWLRKLRKNIILYGDDGLDTYNHCFNYMLSDRITSLLLQPQQTTFFCGVIATNVNDIQQFAANAAEELTEYAFHKKPSAIFTILNFEVSNFSSFKLNADIKYYLQRLLDNETPSEEKYRKTIELQLTPNAGDLLSPKRKKFIDEAYQRGDYKAVLATTDPC